jgi:hypothetical protein
VLALDLGTIAIAVHQDEGFVVDLVNQQDAGVLRRPPAAGDDSVLCQTIRHAPQSA